MAVNDDVSEQQSKKNSCAPSRTDVMNDSKERLALHDQRRLVVTRTDEKQRDRQGRTRLEMSMQPI
jgi:hypothetical protein